MTIKTICLVLAITVLTSCSSTDLATNNTQPNNLRTNKPIFNTEILDPNKIRFSGKGAGAGMMLMSSMGAMGVAIGVAIDEGIGNDIDKTAKNSHFDIEALVLEQLSSTLTTKLQRKLLNEQQGNNVTINILRYGFVIQPGDDDIVAAQLHVDISLNNQPWLTIKHPEQLTPEQQKEIKTAPLEKIKIDGALIDALFINALKQINSLII